MILEQEIQRKSSKYGGGFRYENLKKKIVPRSISIIFCEKSCNYKKILYKQNLQNNFLYDCDFTINGLWNVQFKFPLKYYIGVCTRCTSFILSTKNMNV